MNRRNVLVVAAVLLGFAAGAMWGGGDSPRPLSPEPPTQYQSETSIGVESTELHGAAPSTLNPTIELADVLMEAPSTPEVGDELSPEEFQDPLRDIGLLRPQGEYADGKRHGWWIAKFPDGATQREGAYEEGRKVGEWLYYYPDGRVRCVESFVDGRRHGPCRAYWPDGELHFEVHYENGRPVDGLAVHWHENGLKQREGSYRAGRREGEWMEWYEEGQRASVANYRGGKLTGIRDEWWPNGRLKRRTEHGTAPDGVVLGEWDEHGNAMVREGARE